MTTHAVVIKGETIRGLVKRYIRCLILPIVVVFFSFRNLGGGLPQTVVSNHNQLELSLSSEKECKWTALAGDSNMRMVYLLWEFTNEWKYKNEWWKHFHHFSSSHYVGHLGPKLNITEEYPMLSSGHENFFGEKRVIKGVVSPFDRVD